ncbi:hypothetical protein FMEAI12_4020006 [Parafrankia sp. Ea1.12]|nr:hypothetical protein FMEAI12_4020006 [Parafrankia sp. Ea1.12]
MAARILGAVKETAANENTGNKNTTEENARRGAVTVRGLRRVFTDPAVGEKAVLDGLDLTVAPGEFVALLGRSGCGKSTLLRVLAGIDREVEGDVVVPTRRSVAFQEPRLLPWKKVWRNVALGLTGPDVRLRSLAALAEVGLDHRTDAWPLTLSGGEAQRAALARALVRSPDLLLLDEPCASLDALTRLRMQALIVDLWQAARPGCRAGHARRGGGTAAGRSCPRDGRRRDRPGRPGRGRPASPARRPRSRTAAHPAARPAGGSGVTSAGARAVPGSPADVPRDRQTGRRAGRRTETEGEPPVSTLVRRRPRWVVVPLAAALAFGAACSSNGDTTTPDTAAGPVDQDRLGPAGQEGRRRQGLVSEPPPARRTGQGRPDLRRHRPGLPAAAGRAGGVQQRQRGRVGDLGPLHRHRRAEPRRPGAGERRGRPQHRPDLPGRPPGGGGRPRQARRDRGFPGPTA